MTDPDGYRRVGNLGQLRSGGRALLFDIDADEFETGFVIRHGNSIYCYRNSCPHLGSQLDWNQGEFFSADGRFLVCSTHGARFRPEDGECVAGPCQGQYLTSLGFRIHNDEIYVKI